MTEVQVSEIEVVEEETAEKLPGALSVEGVEEETYWSMMFQYGLLNH